MSINVRHLKRECGTRFGGGTRSPWDLPGWICVCVCVCNGKACSIQSSDRKYQYYHYNILVAAKSSWALINRKWLFWLNELGSVNKLKTLYYGSWGLVGLKGNGPTSYRAWTLLGGWKTRSAELSTGATALECGECNRKKSEACFGWWKTEVRMKNFLLCSLNLFALIMHQEMHRFVFCNENISQLLISLFLNQSFWSALPWVYIFFFWFIYFATAIDCNKQKGWE